MRVIMVTPSYSPIKGGTESLIQNLSRKLNEIGVETDVMTFNMDCKWHPVWQAKNERIDGSNVFKIPALNWFPTAHTDRITMAVNLIPGRFRERLREYDIIHFHGHDLSFPLFSYTIKKPKIFHLHGFSKDFYMRYFLSRLVLKHIAGVYVSVSRAMVKDLLELGIPRSKIAFLPNSVDTDIFRPMGTRTRNMVLFVGRITFDKGLHVLLKSLVYLKDPVHLVIIGPPEWDVAYFQYFLKRVEDENKRGLHKVTYLGQQGQNEIVKYYQRAAVFVLPSFREAFPMVNLEALSCETPVVASNVGGVSEVVLNGQNGVLVPPNNIIRLAQAMQDLLNDDNARERFGREGRKWIVGNFSLEVISRRLSELYERMTANRTR